MCCVCAGTCNHVGNHWYCSAHGGMAFAQPVFTTSESTLYFDFTTSVDSDGKPWARPLRRRIGDVVQRLGARISGP